MLKIRWGHRGSEAWYGRLPAVAAAGMIAALLAGCDPCAGVTSCLDTAKLTIVGRVLEESTGTPARGARVDFVRTGGVTLDADSVRGIADDNGNFVVQTSAATSGSVTGEMVVRSAPGAASPFEYRVFSLKFLASGNAGEANVLPTWSTRPSLPDIGQLVSSYWPASMLVGTRVEFRRTGGVRLAGGDVFQTVSGQGGIFPLFDRQVSPVDAGDVIGDIAADVQGFVVRDFHIRAAPEFRKNADLIVVVVTGPTP